VDRQDATGNGQIPAVAEKAWQTLHAQLTANKQICKSKQMPDERK
jgi:hypothetical protein